LLRCCYAIFLRYFSRTIHLPPHILFLELQRLCSGLNLSCSFTTHKLSVFWPRSTEFPADRH
jgi:hypothetical protein